MVDRTSSASVDGLPWLAVTFTGIRTPVTRDADLADLESVTEPTGYSALDLPRGVSRRAFRERCSAGCVPGARREGNVWICSREAWHSSRARSAPTLRIVPAPLAGDAAIAAAAIASAGLRSTRRSA